MKLGCALREELISFFDDETLSQTKSESPRPLGHPRYDPNQISFFKEDGGISKRKTNLKLKGNRKRTRRGRGEDACATLTHMGLGREFQCGIVHGHPSLPSLIFIA